MNAARGRQPGPNANMGRPPNTPSGQGGGLFSTITKLIGGNANILPLIANLAGNKGGNNGNTSNLLSSLAGMMNNSGGNNPLGALAGIMNNSGGNNSLGALAGMMNNSGGNNPLGALAGMMNNSGGNNPLGALAGMMNNSGNNFSGFNNSSTQMPNLDPNELMAKLSAMMNNNPNTTDNKMNHEENIEDPIIDTKENNDGKFYAQNDNNNANNNNNSFNLENLAALWPLISSFLNKTEKSDSAPHNNTYYEDPYKTDKNQNKTVANTILDLANIESEPYSACIYCTHPCYRRQTPLPTFEQVRKMAQDWSRY